MPLRCKGKLKRVRMSCTINHRVAGNFVSTQKHCHDCATFFGSRAVLLRFAEDNSCALLLVQTSSPVQVMALAAAPTSPPPTSLTQWNERGPDPKFALGECRSLSCTLIQRWQTKVCSRFKCNHEARRVEPSSTRWCIFSRLRYPSSASLTASGGGCMCGLG